MPKQLSRSNKQTHGRFVQKSKVLRKEKPPARKSKPVQVRRQPSRKAVKNPIPSQWRWGNISNERKLDILGIVLALVGFLTLLSLLSSQKSEVSMAWLMLLYRLAGWGTFVLPLGLMGIGLWLVFRNIESLPLLSGERLIGLVLLYFNLLTWTHLLAGGGWELAAALKGGGYLGALFEMAITSLFSVAGAVVVLIAWLLIALALAFDVSIPDLFRKGVPYFQRMWREWRMDRSADETQPLANALPHPEPVSPPPPASELPPGFQPLNRQLNTHSTASRRAGTPQTTFQPVQIPPATSPQVATTPASTPTIAATPWNLPPLEAILDPVTPVAIQANVDQDRGRIIEETLASFGCPAHIVEIHRGPTVTQFGVEPEFIETRNGRTRVRVSKIVSLADDLALALAAARIRIQAPVPGRNYVGIEVPNTEISRVTLREIIESEPYKRLKAPLRFALGKDVAGKPAVADLSAMPHLLIAGTTGSGKSVCVNSILCGLLLYNTPSDLRLVLVDPKRVELTNYNGIPHLLAPVVVEADRVVGALQWMQTQMDSRYHKFAQAGLRNIQEYNARHPDERLPYLVVVIDELADLMMLAPDETERSITRLAQLARATGIHLLLATQRPSVDVLTGLIKANFPARVAFAVASGVDSRVILDQPGAERLLGRGDMLFQAPDASAPVRLQGTFVSDSEIQRLVDYWRLEAARLSGAQPEVASHPAIDSLPAGVPLVQTPLWEEKESSEDGDPLLSEAIELVRREGRASITMLQRRMRIGYTRAARLIDAMEAKEIIGPSLPNSQVREILDYGQTAPPKDDGI